MPQINRMDRLTDKLNKRTSRIMGRLGKINKGVNPYRQEPMADEDRINEYMRWAGTSMEQELRQQMGDYEIDKIHFNMHELENKRMMDNARL